MATKLGKKEMPSGYGPADFKYMGRAATDQGDFGPDVGIADGACVNQFGDANNSKYYHGGVVQTKDGKWWVYFEFGRIEGGKTWENGVCKRSATFQFVQCTNEEDARKAFAKQLKSKNTSRIEKKGKIWVSKTDSKGKSKDGYIIQRLATRERGLPDAYGIKDDTGVKKKASKKTTKKKTTKRKKIDAQPQVIQLATALVGGTMDYARAAQSETGIVPTMEAIQEVRDVLIPDAMKILAKIGTHNDPDKLKAKQLKSKKLQELSKYVATIVPRPIPRGGDPSAILLSSDTILAVQQDLDAFEAALQNEDFEAEVQDNQVDPNKVIGRQITWIDPKSAQGKWIENTWHGMTNNRHGHLRGKFKVLNIFEVKDDAKRKAFIARAQEIAKKRKGTKHSLADLQPSRRTDVHDISDLYAQANICIGLHGTRAVNVAPILQTNLRLPKSLKGVHITGAAFGHGIYFATDWKKSWGYTGFSRSYYGTGGNIKGRGAFMFMCDLTLGKCHMATDTMWTTTQCPRGTDSIFAATGRRNSMSLGNDEHVIFDPNQQFIRYIIEATD